MKRFQLVAAVSTLLGGAAMIGAGCGAPDGDAPEVDEPALHTQGPTACTSDAQCAHGSVCCTQLGYCYATSTVSMCYPSTGNIALVDPTTVPLGSWAAVSVPSYGTAQCPEVGQVGIGNDWDAVKVSATVTGLSECECKRATLKAELWGQYAATGCDASAGCDACCNGGPCPPGCNVVTFPVTGQAMASRVASGSYSHAGCTLSFILSEDDGIAQGGLPPGTSVVFDDTYPAALYVGAEKADGSNLPLAISARHNY